VAVACVRGRPGFISICSDADGWAGRRFTTDDAGLDGGHRVRRQARQAPVPKASTPRSPPCVSTPVKGRGGEDLAHASPTCGQTATSGPSGTSPDPTTCPHRPTRTPWRKSSRNPRCRSQAAGATPEAATTPYGCSPNPHHRRRRRPRPDQELTMTWQAILAAQAYRYGWSWDTEVGNLDRLMKLPGTVNRKEGHRTADHASAPVDGALYDMRRPRAAARRGPRTRRTGICSSRSGPGKAGTPQAANGHQGPVPQPRGEPPERQQPTGDGPLDVLADTSSSGHPRAPRLHLRREPTATAARCGSGPPREASPRAAPTACSAMTTLPSTSPTAQTSRSARSPPDASSPSATCGPTYNYGGDTSAAASDILRAAAGRDGPRAPPEACPPPSSTRSSGGACRPTPKALADPPADDVRGTGRRTNPPEDPERRHPG
jgi:hypothetical protein